MQTGRQTLSSLESAVSRLGTEEGQVDTALRQAAGEAERLRHERTQALQELARVKLGEMEAGRLIRNLDAGERRALQILEDRRLRLDSLTEQRTQAMREVEAAEKDRHGAAAEVERQLEQVEATRGRAEARVRTTPAWSAAKSLVDADDAVAVEAEKKAAQSEQELGARKKPYDDDRLFVYLWKCGYGTSTYKAGNIARLVDGMVAEFVGYLAVRPNYAMLTEIPLRLREHAAAKRRAADERRTVLAAIEREAMLAEGVDKEERLLAEARHRLSATDATAESRRVRMKDLDRQRAELIDAGNDAAYKQALDTVASADGTDTIATLLAEARRTETTADEAIVRRIEALAGGIAKADQDAAELRRAAQEIAKRRLEVERARDRFRGAGYDHPQVVFGNDGAIADVLEQVVRGAVRSGALWDILRGGYGTRAHRGQPGFGQPSFPFPFPMPGGSDTRGGGWREPQSGGGWTPDFGDSSSGGDSGSSGGGDSDEGFTTGGSF